MRFDRPMIRGILPFAACCAYGMQYTVWSLVLDAMGGRTSLSLFACLGTVFGAWLAGILLSQWVCRQLSRPGKILPPVFFLSFLYAAFLQIVAGKIGVEWQKLIVDFTRSAGALLSLSLNTALLFFALPAFLAGMVMQITVLSILHTPERQRPAALMLLFLTGILPFLTASGLSEGWIFASAGADVLSFVSLLLLGVSAILSVSVYGSTPLRRVFYAVACLLLVLCTFYHVQKKSELRNLFSSGTFSRLVHRDSGFARGKPLLEQRTLHHTVSLYEDPDYGFVFCQDGRPKIFGNRFFTTRTLAGYLPLLLRPGVKRAAVLGPDGGYAIPFLARGGVECIDYAGADPAVVKMAIAADDYIVRGTADVKQSPAFQRMHKGVRFTFGEEYDVICLEPEPVWMRGTCRSYGSSLFRRCREAISESGLVSLHLDARALSTKRFVTISRAFTQVFPFSQFWNIGPYDWVLVGAKLPFAVHADEMLALFEKEEVSRDMLRAGVFALPDLFPCLLCGREGIQPWLDRSEGETSWQTAVRLPRIVLGKEEFLLRPNQVEGSRQRTLAWLKPGKMEEDIYFAIRQKTERNVDARALAVAALAEIERRNGANGLQAARDAARINPRDLLLAQFATSLELEGRRRISLGDFRGARKCYENMLSFDEKGALANYGLGFSLRALGENLSAFRHFVRAVEAAPEQVGYRMELAQIAGVLNDFDEAERQYREILKREPRNAEAMFRYAKSLSGKTREKQDFSAAIHYAEQACAVTRWENREYSYGLADIYIAAGRTLEGMGLKRRLKEMGK